MDKPLIRVGTGYDVHRLVRNRDLVLGGVRIDYEYGLLGHSDADVLVHAIMDAIIGALAQGDIGEHFPPDDKAYKDIDSLLLLERVSKGMLELGYEIANIDSTIIAQKPKLKEYKEEMRQNLARVLKIDKNQISVKATTEEGLGFTGRGEGIAAQAVVALIRKTDIRIK